MAKAAAQSLPLRNPGLQPMWKLGALPTSLTQPDRTTSCYPAIMAHNAWFIIFFILNSFGYFLFFLSTSLPRLAEASLLSGLGDIRRISCWMLPSLPDPAYLPWGSWQLPLCRLLHGGTGDSTVWTTRESYSLFVHSDSLWSVYRVYTAIRMPQGIAALSIL